MVSSWSVTRLPNDAIRTMSGTSEPDRMCGVFVTSVLKSWLVTLTVTLPYLAWKALPSAVNRGTSGVETRMFSVTGAVPAPVLAAVGEDAGADELVAAPGAQAARASAADMIVMADSVLRRPRPGRIRMICIETPSSFSRQGCRPDRRASLLLSRGSAYGVPASEFMVHVRRRDAHRVLRVRHDATHLEESVYLARVIVVRDPDVLVAQSLCVFLCFRAQDVVLCRDDHRRGDVPEAAGAKR